MNRTSIGGYGELHLNGGHTDEIDFHRFVLFINHDFNDWIHLFSELELEHAIAGEGKAGEIELEQAWIRFDIKEDKFGPFSKFLQYVDIGQMLIPTGIINETHEPPTFFGVERDEVEKNIIPATLWTAHIDGKQTVTDSVELRLRALWAAWDIDATAAEAIGRDKQEGWYVEPAVVYDTQMWAGKFGVFYRYESFDNEAGSGDATDTEITRQSYGANWWPTENVVVKAEFRDDDHYDKTENDDRWDFGVGYQF